MFKGFVFFEDGTHTEAVNLNTPEEAVNYCKLQMGLQYEVKITDSDDYCVMHAKEGKLIFPVF